MNYRTFFLFVAPAVLATCCFSVSNADDGSARRDAIVVRAIERMKNFDYRSDDEVRAAVLRHLQRAKGTPEYMDLLRRFRPEGMETKLANVLVSGDQSAAVEAAEIMLEMEAGRPIIRDLLDDNQQATKVIEVLGLLGNGRANHFLSQIVTDEERDFATRRAAVEGLDRSRSGQKRLVALAREKKLIGDTFLIAGALLSRSSDPATRKEAAEVLPLPARKDSQPLPPVVQLAKLSGDAAAGQKLFRGDATCANCHIVNEYGKNVGPDLSEIGSKLSREAMLTAILAPSAGISHNYENFVVLTTEGQVITGLKISETDGEVVIRTADAIDRKIAKEDVEQIRKSEKSIMPENLHHITGQDGLIDIVEYMSTLKKKS
jgi:putative heme-binding domain-containing protein